MAATSLVVLLAMSCAYCASRPTPSPIAVSHLGGPAFRVFDTDRIDAVDAIPALASIYAAAEQCAGKRGNFAAVRVFAVTKIEKRYPLGWKDSPSGLQFRDWVYIKAGHAPEYTAWLLEHEFLHHIMRKGHPEVDSLMRSCGLYTYRKQTE